MQHQSAKLEWHENGVPVSTQFDDPYFSLENGLEETRHVFLTGNCLPERFGDGFHIGELGFGTGLNLLAAWQAWIESGQKGLLHFTSFEAFPMTPQDMARGLAKFPVDPALADHLLTAMQDGQTELVTDTLHFRMIVGDARQTVPRHQDSFDAWFLDGFSPAKNPELWQADLMQAVFDHTKPDGSVATYTAAGAVRRALSDAGFTVERIKGYGRKRHMTIARKSPE